MNQDSLTAGRQATRAPVFFWITVGLFAVSLIGGGVLALWLLFEAGHINRSGGWGWLLAVAIYAVAITIVCAASALCTGISLYRREAHRRVSIAILGFSYLVVAVVGPFLVRAVYGMARQHNEASRTSTGTPRPPARSVAPGTIPPAADKSSSTPAIREFANPQALELKAKIWEAIRAKNASALVDCFYVEERFNTAEVRKENQNQMETLLRGETIEVEIQEIPAKELVEITKIQKAKPASLIRYSLVPRMLLRIRQEAVDGHAGRNYLIGEKNGQWYIITMAGHTT